MKCCRWVKTMEEVRQGKMSTVFGAWVFGGSWEGPSLPGWECALSVHWDGEPLEVYRSRVMILE